MAICLHDDKLEFYFPEVHPDAVLTIGLQRTLRVPDDGATYGLPPGLGLLPIRRVADLPAHRLPHRWGAAGLVTPMWQSEACWLNFRASYPFLVKVGAGSINAVTGKTWMAAPDFAEEDYFEVPNQPWLDGFCVAKGTVRQFVAMPLNAGYTVEEQVCGDGVGGLRIAVVPLKAEVYEQRPKWASPDVCVLGAAPAAMGLGAGGAIRQSVETPVEPPENWELDVSSSTWIHIANSAVWQDITGERPPTMPPSATDYTAAGMPWFEWYDDTFARAGSRILADTQSVHELGKRRDQSPLPENESFETPEPIRLGRPPVGIG